MLLIRKKTIFLDMTVLRFVRGQPITATVARMKVPSVRLVLLIWGLSDPRISELYEKPRCVSITLHSKTQVDRLGVISL